MVERVIRTLKEQCVHRHRFETQQHGVRIIEGYRSSAPRGDRPAGERRSEGEARPAAPWRPREDDAARAPREHTARPFAHRDDAARRRRSEGERRHDGAPRRYRED